MACFLHYRFIIYTIVILSCIHFSIAGNNDTDRLALLQIKAKINDPLGALNSWNHSLHFCHWYGVTCGRTNQRVTVLDLQSSQLSGSLSPYIGNLSFLKDLVLQNNSFSGTLPPEIGRLRKLQHFLIFNNSFGGGISSNISRCSQLTKLDASFNKLIGSLPDELGSLLNLQFLRFYSNNLTGSIPSSLGNLSAISTFSVTLNNMVGSISNSFGRLQNLRVLALGGNKLSGIVPSCIFNLSQLMILELGHNDLHGSLPSNIGLTLPALNYLSIFNNSFRGFIPTSIFNLSNLEHLDLNSNQLAGSIPNSFGRLKKLTTLTLYGNKLSGIVPFSIFNLSQLMILDLGNNYLHGSLPSDIGVTLPALNFFSVNSNSFSGFIPTSIFNLTNLILLNLGSNQLEGSIPNSILKLNNLTILGLRENKLSGLVPSLFFNYSRLTALDLAQNNLQGILPRDIGVTLPRLGWLSLASNSFSGVIPPSVSNLSDLQILQLALNNLRGQVPSLKKMVNLRVLLLQSNSLGQGENDDLEFISSLRNATMLLKLAISQNNFSGTFPVTICNSTMLTHLYLGENNIAGIIPTCIDNLTGLRAFDISQSEISGDIPPNLGKLQNLENINFRDNHLSGYIPFSIGNLTKISRLSFGRNNLVGQIPSSIGNCTNLLELDLSHNNLNGSIPSEILSLSALSIGLFLNDNHFTGTLNAEISQLKNLLQLDISNNMLSGEIPTSLSACAELQFLRMENNFFEGAIPSTLKTLMSLQELDLSRNNLSGKIPNFLVDLPLKLLNLSYNNLYGEVPVGGVFGNITGISIVGNDMLCGGIPELKLRKCTNKKTRGKGLMIFGLLGFITLLLSALLGIFWYIKRSRKTANATDTRNSMSSWSYQSLLNATNGFSFDNLIGSGTFGSVYKGIVDSDETLVAIKVFKLEQHGASKSFNAECGVLRNIRHRNLVKVITVCSSVDYQGNDFKALIYEYMVNGSLEDWLHPEARSVSDGINHAYKRLNFRQTLNIAVDVAFALEYLHHGYGESILHCDVKPSNILLDEDMLAHVSDFGLAKSLSTSQGLQSNTLGFRGTVGYAPPEYGLGNQVSSNGDVYSFGILLMEMVTGKRPTSEMFKDGLSLHKVVQAALPEQVIEIIDGTLLEDAQIEDTENRRMRMEAKILEASSSILELALSCSAELPQERLDMKAAVSELTAIRNKFNKR